MYFSGFNIYGREARLKKGKIIEPLCGLNRSPHQSLRNSEAGITLHNCTHLGKRSESVYPCIHFVKPWNGKVLTKLTIQWMRTAQDWGLTLRRQFCSSLREPMAQGFLQLHLEELQESDFYSQREIWEAHKDHYIHSSKIINGDY